jgi:hypothetical protein
MISDLYKKWYQYLENSLDREEKGFFDSVRFNEAPVDHWRRSLNRLSLFLARKSRRGTIVLIDEYETPINCAYEFDFFTRVGLGYSSLL